MRKSLSALAVGALVFVTGAAAAPRMQGFEAIAATAERMDVNGIGWGRKGSFRLGDSGLIGRFSRTSTSGEQWGDVVRRGASSFIVSGNGVNGELAGRCRFEQRDYREEGNVVNISEVTTPLNYHCDFTRDGQAIGSMDLDATFSRKATVKITRRGRIAFAGQVLTLRSVHHLDGTRLPVSTPLGYLIDDRERTVGAVDLNGARKRLALPNEPGLRDAALAASLALAVFWDPASDE